MSKPLEFECECGHVEVVPLRFEQIQNYEGRAMFVCPQCGRGQECLVLPKEFIDPQDEESN